MAGRLAGKVALVTGTGDGIARTTALRFAAEGAKIIGCDINAEKAAETKRLVEEAGGDILSVHPIDLMDEGALAGLMEKAVARFGGIDIVAHYAMAARYGVPDAVSKEDLSFTLDHTVTMSFLVVKHAVPHLRARGGGSIVLTGSISGAGFGAGFAGNLGHVFSYAVSKGGVIRMGVALANYLGRDGIRVNVVSPGAVYTPVAAGLYGEEGSEQRKNLIDRQTLLGRICYSDDITNAALFFASDEASNVTGANLFVDGGFAASGSTGYALYDVEAMVDQMFAAPPE